MLFQKLFLHDFKAYMTMIWKLRHYRAMISIRSRRTLMKFGLSTFIQHIVRFVIS